MPTYKMDWPSGKIELVKSEPHEPEPVMWNGMIWNEDRIYPYNYDFSNKGVKKLNDDVEHPAHYTKDRKYEPWDVIRDWQLNYFAATALKYISRYERKGKPIEDLKKAIEFLKKEISNLQGETK